MPALVSRLFSRQKTTSQSDVNVKPPTHTASFASDESEESDPNPSTFPLVTQLYDEATEFEKILFRSGCVAPNKSCPMGSTGFANLLGHDLTNCERAIFNRDAKLCAATRQWPPPLKEDPQVLPFDAVDETSTSSSSSYLSDIQFPLIHRPTREIEHLDELKPEVIVDILVREFGRLAAKEEEEKLLLETDGCLLHDVAIVGVIHLTTHRLTFHASLLATRPDLASTQGVIKAGPAVFHRKGWRSKRRVWLELSHDMFCAYASSKEKDRTRPICTLLLTFVKDVVPLDLQKPRIIKVTVESSLKRVNEYAEFDTEESAREWRKEITGALFNYRHLRKEIYTSSSPHSEGVSLSCPLTQITHIRSSHSLDFTSIMALTIEPPASEFQFEKNEAAPEPQTLEMGPIESIPVWDRLCTIISDAKQRAARTPSDCPAPVIVDFGPYNFFENEPVPVSRSSSEINVGEENSIRCALGFNPDSNLWIARARIYRTVTCSGYFVVSQNHLGFWSKNITQQDLRYRLPLSMVKYVKPFKLNWLGVEGISIGITGKSDAKIVFKNATTRDQALKHVDSVFSSHSLSHSRPASPSPSVTSRTPVPTFTSILSESPPGSPQLLPSNGPIPGSRKREATRLLAPLSRSLAAAVAAAAELTTSDRNKIPKVLNLPPDILMTRGALHFVCLTIGSRGDVQPYIALGLGLKKEGHTVTIVTHEEYRDWIVGFGLSHRTAGGDPAALMKLSVENKMFSPDFFRESLTNFRPWLDQLLVESWIACQDAEVLLESPSAMAGVHIAEALNIPYFRTFTMPWTKTTEFPHAFLSPPVVSPTFNSASYVLFSNVIWAATSKQINRWRRHALRIGNTDMGHMAQSKITFIYNFSKAVVPKPLDWPDTTIVSGYWFLDNPELNWEPSQELLDFMAKARADGKPVVYIGFGSITVPHPHRVTASIVKAVLQSDVRAIITKGWSGRLNASDKDPPPEIPPECFLMDKVPHDWLFPRIDAALHHGGAGTTGASLRAGIPTLIKPWFGDQYFWASRVQLLGAGLKVQSLRSHHLASALIKATRTEDMKAKARAVGEQIRMEDGVHTTIYTIYTYLHRASQDRSSLDKA